MKGKILPSNFFLDFTNKKILILEIILKIVLACISLLSIRKVLVSGCPPQGGGGRRRRGGGCSRTHCEVASWTWWDECSHRCGSTGTQTRTRRKTRSESCGGACPYSLSETRPCNRNECRNGGRAAPGYCSCIPGFKGTCCEYGE